MSASKTADRQSFLELIVRQTDKTFDKADPAKEAAAIIYRESVLNEADSAYLAGCLAPVLKSEVGPVDGSHIEPMTIAMWCGEPYMIMWRDSCGDFRARSRYGAHCIIAKTQTVDFSRPTWGTMREFVEAWFNAF